MISDELLERYHIDKERFLREPLAGYLTFLGKTDYVSNKISESIYLKTTLDEDYIEVLNARQYARDQVGILTSSNQNDVIETTNVLQESPQEISPVVQPITITELPTPKTYIRREDR